MGILQNVRERLGTKVNEYKEHRERDKKEYNEHYSREYEKARASEIKKTARNKAKQDAYNRIHPTENITKRLSAFGGSMRDEARGKPGNSLGRSLAPLGDFGRSIGRQYNNPGDHLPPALRDFDKPKKRRY